MKTKHNFENNNDLLITFMFFISITMICGLNMEAKRYVVASLHNMEIS